jgi:hypothetical protein
MPRKTGDYDDAEEYLESQEEAIEREEEKPYDELTKKEQTRVIYDKFFASSGLKGEHYERSAELLREGLGRPSGRANVFRVNLRGNVHHVERDAKGRFKKWLD